MNILVKWATRERWKTFWHNFAAWDTGRVKFLVSADQDDPGVIADGTHSGFISGKPHVEFLVSPPAGKAAAMNAGLAEREWDIVVMAQDDVIPVPGYDIAIADAFRNSPFGLDAVLYAPDGCRQDDLNTQCIVGRDYFDRFGYLYHPDYKSLWCDNEFCEVSRSLGREIRHPAVLLQHHWIGYKPDALLTRNESFYGIDRETYLRRKAAEFPK